MDIATSLVEKLCDINFDNLPTSVIEKTKLLVLDTIGTAIAGSSAQGCREVVDQVVDWGGKAESTIFVYGQKVPAFLAAFANSLMAHARDFDDTHDKALVHSMVSVFPAGLAVAEQTGNITGPEFITAITLGAEVIYRLSLSLKPEQAKDRSFSGWHFSAITGCFGSAATAAKLLKFDKTTMHNALGIVYSQAAGSRQPRADGVLTKRMQPAFAAKSGVFSAYLAAKGITGATNIFEGDYGFYKLYKDPSLPHDAEVLTSELGQKFEIMGTSLKPYPCARPTHAAIRPTIDLVKAENIQADRVEFVNVSVPYKSFEAVGKPFKIRTNPQVDAQFSIPYTVALAISKQDVSLADFEIDAVRNPEIVGLAEKVKVHINPEVEGWTPVEIEITLKDGRTYSAREDALKGSPENPMDKDEVANKFQECTKIGTKPLSNEKIQGIIDLVDKLEKVQNMDELAKSIC